jgi:hypothetical protein
MNSLGSLPDVLAIAGLKDTELAGFLIYYNQGDIVCLFATGLKKGESRGQTMSHLLKKNPSCTA